MPLPSSTMKRIWDKCGSPRENPSCWKREMKKAWGKKGRKKRKRKRRKK